MTLQQLKYVIMIVEKGSMNGAAESLYISQPSLSNAIKELENELKIKIFSRNNKGTVLTRDGKEFLGYAKQVVAQSDLLEEKYFSNKQMKKKFSVSSQHYQFVVKAFVELLKKYDTSEYDFTLKETKTYEIINDVKNYISEIGVIYLNNYNEKVINKILKENKLLFRELLILKPHVFLSVNHPLANKEKIKLIDLENYPFISFDQGENSSFYLSEEVLSDIKHIREIKVSDRATMSNMIIGLNGYTIGSGMIDEKLNGKDLITIPLDEKSDMRIGMITKDMPLSLIGEEFFNIIKNYG